MEEAFEAHKQPIESNNIDMRNDFLILLCLSCQSISFLSTTIIQRHFVLIRIFLREGQRRILESVVGRGRYIYKLGLRVSEIS